MNLIYMGYNCNQILKILSNKIVNNLEWSTHIKFQMIQHLSETDFQIRRGGDPELQLLDLFYALFCALLEEEEEEEEESIQTRI